MSERLSKQSYYQLLIRSAFDGTFPSVEIPHDRASSCLYRKNYTAGCKQRCAIGLLIPDELYTLNLDPSPIECVMNLIEIPEGMTKENLIDIQFTHDDQALSCTEWLPDEFVRRINKLDCFADLIPQGV